MKIKTVLIAMCSTTILFSSCEKAEMDKGIIGGGGMLDETIATSTPPITATGKGIIGGGGMLIEELSLKMAKSTATNVDTSINILRSLDINAKLGVVNVKIANSAGETIYSNNINTNIKTSSYISRSNFETGNYTIIISGQDGEIIQQDNFIIE